MNQQKVSMKALKNVANSYNCPPLDIINVP